MNNTPLTSQPNNITNNNNNLTTTSRIEALRRLEGGIYCANVNCTNKAQHRRQGHQECSDLFCKSCCNKAATQAYTDHVPRATCAVRSHRLVGTMGVMQPMQSSTPVETDGGQAATDSFQQQLSSASIQLDAAIRARETTSNGTARSLAHTANAFYEDPPLVGYTRTQDLQQQPLVQPAPQYAAPIAKMWQVPTVGWLDARRKAAIEDNSRVDYKKVAAETKIAQKQSVSVMLWTRNGADPINIRLYVKAYPMFAIKHFPELGEILLSDGRKHTETWNAQKEHWECHAEDTIRTVETEVVLLYRVLPAGIAGDRLHDCPQLSEEISKQHKGAFRSAPKRRRVLDDDDDDRRAPTKRLRAPTLASGTDQVMFDKSQESPLRIDASMPLLPSQQLAKPSQTQVKQAVAGPGDNSSNKPVPGVASGNNNVLLKTRPLASNEVSTSGERLFPASFYAVDVIEGFECMDDLMKQRRPRIYQGAAFTAVFGLPYVRSTYQKHRRIYDDNQDLVPKFKAHARSSKGTWTKFRLDGMEIVDPDSESEVQDRDSKGVSEEQDVDEYGTFGEGDGGHENPFDLEKHEHSPEYDNAHWATCCAYCDELIVPQQSGKLLRLQEHLDSKSILDGTNGKDASRNPYHRYIRPITATTEYCAQHRFESTVIPAVLLKATWAAALPVDFDALPIRLEELKPMLDETVNSPFDNVFFRALCESVKGQGLTRTLGAEGEYLSFRKTSAGYYGERGIAIAFAVLRRLYACHARDTLWGFPFLKFVERVLIPEVATLLIQDDFGLDSGLLKDRNAALKIKDDSTVYGNMQYPYEDADDADG